MLLASNNLSLSDSFSYIYIYTYIHIFICIYENCYFNIWSDVTIPEKKISLLLHLMKEFPINLSPVTDSDIFHLG